MRITVDIKVVDDNGKELAKGTMSNVINDDKTALSFMESVIRFLGFKIHHRINEIKTTSFEYSPWKG